MDLLARYSSSHANIKKPSQEIPSQNQPASSAALKLLTQEDGKTKAPLRKDDSHNPILGTENMKVLGQMSICLIQDSQEKAGEYEMREEVVGQLDGEATYSG